MACVGEDHAGVRGLDRRPDVEAAEDDLQPRRPRLDQPAALELVEARVDLARRHVVANGSSEAAELARDLDRSAERFADQFQW